MDEVGKNPYSNQVVGTYGFMAPEIFHEPYYSYSVDVWAIGVVT
jgi:serine/threonine protein kinase